MLRIQFLVAAAIFTTLAGPLLAPALAKDGKPPTVEDVVRAAAGDSAKLGKLLESGGPANGHGKRNATPLGAAAMAGNREGVALLLRRGAAVNEIGSRGTTPLGWAAHIGNDEIMKMLLDAGADIDAAANPGRTPLAIAVAQNHLSSAKLLLERGTRVLDDPGKALAVLESVVESGALAGLEARRPNDPEPMTTSEKDGREMIALVVRPLAPHVAASPEFADVAAEAVALASPRLAPVMLDELGPAATSKPFQTTMLFKAATHSRPHIATLALGRGADANAKHPNYGSPLALAVTRGDAETVGILLGAGADPKSDGVDAAKLKALAGNVLADRDALQESERTGDINGRGPLGRTLLFIAAERGDEAMVTTLLSKKADPSVTTERWPDDGWTPLMAAAAAGHVGIVEKLLKAGADVDASNANGRTALMFAAWYGRAAVIQALLARGASPHTIDELGHSAATLAQACGDPPAIAAIRGEDPATAVAPTPRPGGAAAARPGGVPNQRAAGAAAPRAGGDAVNPRATNAGTGARPSTSNPPAATGAGAR